MTYGQGGTTEGHHHSRCWHKCISWTAILTGALVGIGLSFLLNLFSIAIGLSAFSLSQEGMTGLAVGGLIGMSIGVIIAMFLAGLTAGYLGRPYCNRRHLGILYGFTTWCVALIITALVTTYVGRYVSSYGLFITNPTVVSEQPEQVRAETRSPTVSPAQIERATNTFGMGAFVLFFLFFVGAVASCFGGHCGMSCRDRENEFERC